jgi:hypothetical protein
LKDDVAVVDIVVVDGDDEEDIDNVFVVDNDVN